MAPILRRHAFSAQQANTKQILGQLPVLFVTLGLSLEHKELPLANPASQGATLQGEDLYHALIAKLAGTRLHDLLEAHRLALLAERVQR